jgi:hypothetical protein
MAINVIEFLMQLQTLFIVHVCILNLSWIENRFHVTLYLLIKNFNIILSGCSMFNWSRDRLSDCRKNETLRKYMLFSFTNTCLFVCLFVVSCSKMSNDVSCTRIIDSNYLQQARYYRIFHIDYTVHLNCFKPFTTNKHS